MTFWYMASASDRDDPYSMVVNASNREKIVAWLEECYPPNPAANEYGSTTHTIPR